jgi:hypothetical protein
VSEADFSSLKLNFELQDRGKWQIHYQDAPKYYLDLRDRNCRENIENANTLCHFGDPKNTAIQFVNITPVVLYLIFPVILLYKPIINSRDELNIKYISKIVAYFCVEKQKLECSQ